MVITCKPRRNNIILSINYRLVVETIGIANLSSRRTFESLGYKKRFGSTFLFSGLYARYRIEFPPVGFVG